VKKILTVLSCFILSHGAYAISVRVLTPEDIEAIEKGWLKRAENIYLFKIASIDDVYKKEKVSTGPRLLNKEDTYITKEVQIEVLKVYKGNIEEISGIETISYHRWCDDTRLGEPPATSSYDRAIYDMRAKLKCDFLEKKHEYKPGDMVVLFANDPRYWNVSNSYYRKIKTDKELKEFEKISIHTYLNGVWHSSITGNNEAFGAYEFTTILTIQDDKYTWMEERVSEGPFWSSGERGSLAINNSEVVLSKKEQAYGQWDLHWENEEGTTVYNFSVTDNVLILMQEDREITFTKE